MKKTILTLALLVSLGGLAFGQTLLTTTTLSAAVPSGNSSATTSGNQGIVVVASATGISGPTPNSGNVYGAATSEAQTYLFVDRELMEVKAVSGTTVTVIRAVGPTTGTSHASGALVFIVPANIVNGGNNTRAAAMPTGSCTRTNELYLPRIEFASGVISDCLGGQWVNGDSHQTQRALTILMNPPTGGTLYTALETNGTAAGASTEMYCTQINMPFSKLMTGLKILNGTTVGTDKHMVILYDGTGNLLANSATAGATTSGASTYQSYAFTSPFYAVGPAVYFGCFTANGTTDTVRHLVTAADQGLLAGKITGLTFGTVAATITAPSTFTTALGAYLELY